MPNQNNADNEPELTARQVRAARALLAWSQQDLAKQAGVATSTVADFERGQRTPVPNNAEAMRAALTTAGITFLAGGAIVGPPIPLLATKNKSGAPVRWVNATDLSQWAELRDGQSTLPNLIAKLVRAVGGGPSVHLRFPADEGIQHAGWDGSTRADEATEYVPKGTAGWELSTQRTGIAKKANDDYAKRIKDSGELIPADSTFIFVTPRHWPKKDEWARKKRDEGIWRDVRAYDGDNLVHWIELYPAVGQWIATRLGKRPSGVRNLDEVWLEWSLATRWPLTAELVLTDRDEDATAILQWLRSDSSPFSLQGETADEVIAFFHAAINLLPAEVAEHYLARCLVATTPESARALADSAPSLIIVLYDPEPGLAQLLAKRGHHVLLAYGGNPDLPGARQLRRPSRDGIERALIDAGIAEGDARSLARESSRSLAILRRLIPSAPGRLPDWTKPSPAHALLAALLAGAWDEACEFDKTILARLGDVSYDKLAIELAPFVNKFDSPLRKVGTAWKIASPQDAWFLLAPYLSSTDIERFVAIAIDVLGTPDPRFKVEPEERWLASTRGIAPQYSEFLRHGLGEILILLSLYGTRAQSVADAHERADHIVRKLLQNADRERWWSLSRDFQLLAEASPSAFLDAVDHSLGMNDPPIRALFGEDGGPLFGGEHLSNLLWALEALAWSPEYLGRVSEILARLDTLDTGGRYTNRPANSLRQTYLLWAPQTNATLDQRLRAIDRLRKSQSDPAWRLMLGILPSGHDTFSPSPPTRWRRFTAENAEIITYALIGKGAAAITERLLEDVGISAVRWSLLLGRLADLAPDRQAAIRQLTEIEPNIRTVTDRLAVRDTLRKILNHHRQYPDAGWALPEGELTAIERIYDAFASADPIQSIVWLFASSVQLPRPTHDGWQADFAKVADEQRLAVKSLFDQHGVERIFDLVHNVESADKIGLALAQIGLDASTRDEIIARALQSGESHDRGLADGLVRATFEQAKEPWAAALIERAIQNNWSVEALVTILRALPYGQWTWDHAHTAGDVVESCYWQQAPILWIQDSLPDMTFAINKLMEVGRARHAIHLIGRDLPKRLPADLVINVLKRAVSESWGKDSNNDHVMFQHHVAEILQRLDSDASVSQETMLALEWAYLPLLEYSQRPAKVLLRALSEQPAFFMEVLRALFKPTVESGVVEQPPENEKHAQAIASQAFSLLRIWDRVPGTTDSGTIDGEALEAWIKGVRTLAAESGRAEIADQKIGEILSASPTGNDGIWPAVAVRDAIEKFSNSQIESGFVMGRRNRRGVTSRLPRSGGALERTEVEKYRGYAKATAFDWPHTSMALGQIAKSYEEDARWHDEDAERMDWH